MRAHLGGASLLPQLTLDSEAVDVGAPLRPDTVVEQLEAGPGPESAEAGEALAGAAAEEDGGAPEGAAHSAVGAGAGGWVREDGSAGRGPNGRAWQAVFGGGAGAPPAAGGVGPEIILVSYAVFEALERAGGGGVERSMQFYADLMLQVLALDPGA
jgi:hypothetical protein